MSNEELNHGLASGETFFLFVASLFISGSIGTMTSVAIGSLTFGGCLTAMVIINIITRKIK